MRGDDVSENFKIQLLFDRNNSSISLFIVLQYGEFKSSIVNDARSSGREKNLPNPGRCLENKCTGYQKSLGKII